ncbi:L-alanine exporter AlaE [Candidatus Woesearchaeota archaeon]|nr:L-alanine exporter AlaE [Candidatus Woesearchaeota archaeon]
MIEKAKEKIKNFIIDAIALNTFSYILTAPIELLIVGLPFQAHLQVRLFAAILNTLTARPYTNWRTFIFRKASVNSQSSWKKKYLWDTLTFASMQAPIYFTSNMIIGGGDLYGVIQGTLVLTMVSGVVGRPYGAYLDVIRDLFGLGKEYDLTPQTARIRKATFSST